MNVEKKVENSEDWLCIFQEKMEISISKYSEPEQQLFTQALLSCQNDYLFTMLIANSVNKTDPQHFINQSDLFQEWKDYTPSQGYFSDYINNCRSDEPCWPLSFRIFIKHFDVFNEAEASKKNDNSKTDEKAKRKSHPLHIPGKFSFFFHTLFSSWKKKMIVPQGIPAQAMTILKLWDNFQNEIKIRCSSSSHPKNDFYCTAEFNLKLFQFLFSVKSEIIKKSLESLKFDVSPSIYLGNSFLVSEFIKIESTVSMAQAYIPYPALQLFVLSAFKEQLVKVYYTSKDFENSDLFSTSDTKIIKYRDCNDNVINSLIQRLKQLFINFKDFFKQVKNKCTTTVEQNGINITCLKSDYKLDEYKIFIYNEFVRLCAIIHDEIRLAESEFNKNPNTRTFSPTIFRIITSFFDKFKSQWPKTCQQHLRMLEYNSEAPRNDRRQVKMIEQKAHCFYPIDEFVDDIQRQLSSLQKKIEKVTIKTPISSPVFSKQEKIEDLRKQTETNILQCANILHNLDPALPILECSAKSIFKYLRTQGYYKSTE